MFWKGFTAVLGGLIAYFLFNTVMDYSGNDIKEGIHSGLNAINEWVKEE